MIPDLNKISVTALHCILSLQRKRLSRGQEKSIPISILEIIREEINEIEELLKIKEGEEMPKTGDKNLQSYISSITPKTF